MTRSIPSIIVLTLMCFTISYGLVRFPDDGILDAAQGVDSPSPSEPQMAEVWKPPVDGASLKQLKYPAASVLPEQQAPSTGLFVEQSTPTSANGDFASNDESGALNNPVEKESEPQSNPEPEADKSSEEANKNSSDNASAADASADKSESVAEAAPSNDTELPGLENAPEEQEEINLIGIPDDDVHTNSMPIEVEDNPLPTLDPLDSDIPPVQVPSSLTEAEKAFEPEQNEEPPFEPEIDSDMTMTPEQEQAVDDFWNKKLDGIEISNDSTSEKEDKSAADSASVQEKQTPAASAPFTIPSDPNAQEIPARNREKKPANQGALTLPALDEPQNVAPKSGRPDTGTIPLETFPLDTNDDVKPVNFTTNSQVEPFDPFGIRVPEAGQIVVRRLPPIENSVDPIYNNAQLDRFAL